MCRESGWFQIDVVTDASVHDLVLNGDSAGRRGLTLRKAVLTAMDFVKELLQFLRHRRKLWLLPVILILVLTGFLSAGAIHGAIAVPFMYTLF